MIAALINNGNDMNHNTAQTHRKIITSSQTFSVNMLLGFINKNKFRTRYNIVNI